VDLVPEVEDKRGRERVYERGMCFERAMYTDGRKSMFWSRFGEAIESMAECAMRHLIERIGRYFQKFRRYSGTSLS
jgi:hypothetical protein